MKVSSYTNLKDELKPFSTNMVISVRIKAIRYIYDNGVRKENFVLIGRITGEKDEILFCINCLKILRKYNIFEIDIKAIV